MKINRIQLYHVEIPLAETFYPAWIPDYPQTVNRFTLAVFTTDDDVEGVAAGAAFAREREGLGTLLGPYLLGVDPTDIPAVRQRLREASYLGWRNYWIEAACWDIKGKVENKPVWALLGGTARDRAPVYASTGEIHPPAQRAEEVLQLKDMGFHTVKLRVHSANLSTDLEQIETVRNAVDDSVKLAVDANQGWRVTIIGDAPLWTLERARQFADAAADLDVEWIEEPLDMHAYHDLAELREGSEVPIAGGELNAGWHEFKVMLEEGSLDIYQPDATMGGGITEVLEVVKACEQQGLGFSPHTWTNGLGLMINLHLWASGPQTMPLEFPYEPPGWVPANRDGLLAEPITAEDGTIPIPSEPGLGIRIDHQKLRKYGEKFYETTPMKLAIRTMWDKGPRTALELRRKRQ